jgi:hypothetical protein
MQTSNFILLMTLYSNCVYFGSKALSKLITFCVHYITGEFEVKLATHSSTTTNLLQQGTPCMVWCQITVQIKQKLLFYTYLYHVLWCL